MRTVSPPAANPRGMMAMCIIIGLTLGIGFMIEWYQRFDCHGVIALAKDVIQ